MEFVENSKRIALWSHSMWAVYLGTVALWLPSLAMWHFGYPVVSPLFWLGLAQICFVYGAIGRLKKQRKVSG